MSTQASLKNHDKSMFPQGDGQPQLTLQDTGYKTPIHMIAIAASLVHRSM